MNILLSKSEHVKYYFSMSGPLSSLSSSSSPSPSRSSTSSPPSKKKFLSCDSTSDGSSPQLELPVLVRAQPIRAGSDHGESSRRLSHDLLEQHTVSRESRPVSSASGRTVTNRRRTYHESSPLQSTRPDHESFERRSSFLAQSASSVLAQPGIDEWVACLDLHLIAPHANPNTIEYFLKGVIDGGDDIARQGRSREVIRISLVAMGKFRTNEKIQKRCMYLLVMFPAHDLPTRRGITCVLAAMRNHPESDFIQSRGCQLLADILTASPATTTRTFTTFSAEGGLECVLQASKQFPNLEPTCKKIRNSLFTIAQKHQSYNSNFSSTSRRAHDERASLARLHAGLVAFRLSS